MDKTQTLFAIHYFSFVTIFCLYLWNYAKKKRPIRRANAKRTSYKIIQQQYTTTREGVETRCYTFPVRRP